MQWLVADAFIRVVLRGDIGDVAMTCDPRKATAYVGLSPSG